MDTTSTLTKKRTRRPRRRGYNLTTMDDEQSHVVEPLKPFDPRDLFRPVRTAAGDAEHYEKLDGAMDAAFAGELSASFERSVLSSFTTFVGYGALQELSQNALIRLCVQTRTDEMLREWIDIKCDDDERKKALEKAIADKAIKDKLSEALTLMGMMGGAYLFIDTATDANDLINPLNKSERSDEVKQDGSLSFRVIDPIFTTPQSFNANNPLAEDFYCPNVFNVMGTNVHKSRLIRFVENEVPDLLKPSYNFLGLPQAQILSDYVTDFRRNREEVNRLLQKFSTSIIKGDLKGQLYNGKAISVLTNRVKLFAKYRNNNGVALLDKDSEDFVQTNAPLQGLTDIVRQSLEFVVSVNQSGVVKTLGYTPNGFSSGESDVKLQADLIATRQEKILRKPIEQILRLLQLHLFGEIDPELTFDFNPLDADDDRAVAEVRKLRADTAAIYLDRGVLTEDEVRETLKADDDGTFKSIEGEAPGMPEEPFGQMESLLNGEAESGI